MNTLSPLLFLPRVLIFMTLGFAMLLICDAAGDAIGPIVSELPVKYLVLDSSV